MSLSSFSYGFSLKICFTSPKTHVIVFLSEKSAFFSSKYPITSVSAIGFIVISKFALSRSSV